MWYHQHLGTGSKQEEHHRTEGERQSAPDSATWRYMTTDRVSCAHRPDALKLRRPPYDRCSHIALQTRRWRARIGAFQIVDDAARQRIR
jgi:hypothetical protein